MAVSVSLKIGFQVFLWDLETFLQSNYSNTFYFTYCLVIVAPRSIFTCIIFLCWGDRVPMAVTSSYDFFPIDVFFGRMQAAILTLSFHNSCRFSLLVFFFKHKSYEKSFLRKLLNACKIKLCFGHWTEKWKVKWEVQKLPAEVKIEERTIGDQDVHNWSFLHGQQRMF